MNKLAGDITIRITIKIAPVRPKIRTVSSILTSRILPKRKLRISIVNPPEKLISINPTAIPVDNKTATDASPEILKLLLSNSSNYQVH